MHKFLSPCGIVGLSHFADGRDLPHWFHATDVVRKNWVKQPSQTWAREMLVKICEEDNIELDALLQIVSEAGLEHLLERPRDKTFPEYEMKET